MLIFFKRNIKFESTIMSAPSMITFIAPKFEETLLNPFNNCEFIIIPLIIIFSHEKSGESFLRGPLNRNPFQSLWSTSSTNITIHLIWKMWNNLNWNFPVDIIFNLFD